MSENTFICAHCGKSCTSKEVHAVRGDFLCASCLTELTTQCTHCGDYLYHEDNEGTEEPLHWLITAYSTTMSHCAKNWVCRRHISKRIAMLPRS